MKNFILVTLVTLTSFASKIYAQCSMYPISLDERIDRSELIIEGVVKSRTGFVNPDNGNISTGNIIEIHKIFKGNIEKEEIILVSPGGIVDDRAEEVIPSIELEENTLGIYFLKNSQIIADDSYLNFQPYSGPQGCIYLNTQENKANDVFKSYYSIENVYEIIESKLGNNMKVVKKMDQKISAQNKSLIEITSISPDTTIAGIKEEIIIRGKEFGANRGSGVVEFTNASTGLQFVKPTSTDYRFWSDTMIIVRVPSGAGTGPIKITGQGGIGIKNSPFIKFAQLNYIITSPKQPFHKDDNQNGGFTWRISTGFDSDNGAKNAFLRAMNNWRDNTCINWENGTITSANQAIDDGINIVRYATSNELPNGVLGVTRSYYRTCGPQTCYVYEIDLSYSPTVNWYKGTGFPSFNQHDMESVIVHELGHAHQLGHVKDESDFMFATLGQGKEKRDLINNNIEAGLYVMKNSVIPYDCGPAPMVGVSGCNIPLGIHTEIENNIEIFPNPASDVVYFKNFGDQNRQIDLYDLEGKLLLQFNLNEKNNTSEWLIPNHIQDGLYFFRNANSGELLGRIIIER